MAMSEVERFLFDAQGYLVVRGFLDAGEVAELNAAIDANADRIIDDPNAGTGGSPALAGAAKRQLVAGMLSWPQPWCEPFRRLLVHPKLRPYLGGLLGPGWRLDHQPAIFLADPGAEGLTLHGWGQSRAGGPAFHLYANGDIRCGMVSLEFMLAPVPPGAGGFVVLPGGHKANIGLTEEVVRAAVDEHVLDSPAFDAGDLLIFSEASVHGTLPWRGPGQRRALLYRYSPRWLNWENAHFGWTHQPWVDELTDDQRAVLEPPYAYDRPIITDDGTVTRPRLTSW